ncbi:MAG: protein-L-isoaspartate(D-aspartate) O-methyltransferase [Candidatus Delongbacteria bacterium]|nr:protein-L-isoaspartate(D-aspartate) O-methyltransferase [Candidatus Delongbacteria bacterium]
MNSGNYRVARNRLVQYLHDEIKIDDQRLLAVFNSVPRERFVDSALGVMAYKDAALPIGYNQTISKPSTVAIMTAALRLQGHERILEIGTGSGFQTAILAGLVREVYSIERLAVLSQFAQTRLDNLKITNAYLRIGDGHIGWAEQQPYHGIIITAFMTDPPFHLLDQLTPGFGRIVFPMGTEQNQQLYLLVYKNHQPELIHLNSCLFVPMITSNPERISG